MDETYTLQMEVPQGYIVDELPKSMVLKLNEQEDGLLNIVCHIMEKAFPCDADWFSKKQIFCPKSMNCYENFSAWL
jgi:hypothetical protein